MARANFVVGLLPKDGTAVNVDEVAHGETRRERKPKAKRTRTMMVLASNTPSMTAKAV
jgi:hypothetical protein